MRHGYAKSKPMPTERDTAEPAAAEAAQSQPERRPLPPAAERALAEAAARRAERERNAATAPKGIKEINGPAGPDPTRYGDWEINGIAADF
jgi:hypothetical protein